MGKNGGAVNIKLDKKHAIGTRLVIDGDHPMSLVLGASTVGIDSLRKAEAIIEGAPEGTLRKEEALEEVRKFI